MTLLASRTTGEVRDVDLDLDFITDYEAQHPDWSLMDLVKHMDRMRFTDMDLMARCFGFDDLRSLVDEGYTIADLSKAMEGSKYLGFSDGTAED